MIYALFLFWVLSAILMLKEHLVYRLIIYFGVFSLVASLAFLVLGAPDVAMAEAAISAFSTIFFIICFEKYFGVWDEQGSVAAPVEIVHKFSKNIIPLVFTIVVCGLFIYFMPTGDASTYLKNQYISFFMRDVGGENAVTAIYLGYRVYDTLFEALMLAVSTVGVVHMSFYAEQPQKQMQSVVKSSSTAVYIIRIISPVLLLFGVYLILNGHITPGGGFQGGVAVAYFFVCRYLIYDVYDMDFDKIARIEDITFACIILLAIAVIFMGIAVFVPYQHMPVFQNIYLSAMNSLIGLKVACGFLILFCRYIVIERK